MRLHEAIKVILEERGEPVRAAELADEINQRSLYERRDGQPLPAYQVRARVHAYPELFEANRGEYSLRQDGATLDLAIAEEMAGDDAVVDADSEPQAQPGNRISRSIAREHFVAAELSKRGWIATLTAKNTPQIDVLATRLESERTVRIQVKTRGISYRHAWRVTSAGPTSDSDFFLFVDLGDLDESPTYWIVPASTVEGLITSEQVRTADLDDFAGRWDLLDPEPA